MLKMMIPIIIGLKLKFIAFMKITALVVTAIAKKALVVAIISLFMSSYLGLKVLINQRKGPNHHFNDHHQVHEHIVLPGVNQNHQAYSGYQNYIGGPNHISRQGFAEDEIQYIA